MQYLVIFSESVLPVFVVILLAFIYNRIFRPDISGLANLALTVFAPVFVFESLIRHSLAFGELIQPFVFMVLLTGTLAAASSCLAFALRLGPSERTSLVLGTSMINVGNFGLPLIYFTFGRDAVPLSIVYFVIFNIPLSTLAIYLSSDKSRLRDILLDVMKIPIFHAFLLALLVAWLQVPVPASLQKGLRLVSQGAIPLLIFVLGLQLANITLSGLRHRVLVFAAIVSAGVAIRLIASPLAAAALLSLLPVQGLERSVAIVQTSGPAAILPLMYTIRFNRSPELLAAVILFTTLLSGLTLPLVIDLV
jgi:hypothetical protein